VKNTRQLVFDRKIYPDFGYSHCIIYLTSCVPYLDIFVDTKEVIRSNKSRSTNDTMTKRKGKKGQTMIYKTPHRKLKIEHHEHH